MFLESEMNIRFGPNANPKNDLPSLDLNRAAKWTTGPVYLWTSQVNSSSNQSETFIAIYCWLKIKFGRRYARIAGLQIFLYFCGVRT